jgi:MFS superfamily sulfate permease-like transporter
MAFQWKFILEGLALAFIASAETLLTATAVDRMHQGPRTKYDRELMSQGLGNVICGLLGALPMTGVIVRSGVNVHAGARTRLSTVLHGIWLLLFVLIFPHVLRQIPVASLAALLVYTGFKLLNPAVVKSLLAYGKSEVAIYLITVATIVATDLLTGVLTGVGLSVARLLYIFSHLEAHLTKHPEANRVELHLKGAATFLSLPKLASTLESIPPDTEFHVHFEDLDYIDHACLDLLMNWETQHKAQGGALVIDWGSAHAMFRDRRRTPRKAGKKRAVPDGNVEDGPTGIMEPVQEEATPS